MIVYRICKAYPPAYNPIDGAGSFKNGGRWNSKGTYAVYTSSSISLARSEMARHVNLESVPDGFSIYEIEIPNDYFINILELPDDWSTDPPAKSTQILGDELLKSSQILGIKVPSVCDKQSFNYILNPISTYYKEVKVVRHYPFVP